MQVKKLNDQVTVAPQITPADVAVIAQAGFKCVMMNRPDGEEAGQPCWNDIVEACEAAGVEARYVPMGTRELTERAVEGFRAAMDEVDGPIFAFCRSGARCEILWNAARAMAAAN
ncbi:TIGR01244 family sulfur transferase [Aliiroseovarius subalbicans]|uniref:TIGR01244 family sulfur transferase n=1 Tax=Aliiroseovarius subalbicans TaxID=2925840 RepID=UPI001F57F6FC|nr:TIGR01244 family sulfur transferase [Aliiroseovarius subalbicans]MCI2398127.1 TIGR01244 family sulfur transferase [Aliiroseovarius subalbicans]